MSSVGQAAVERGYITGSQLQEAMAIQERVMLDGLNESLEEIFLKKGWLTPDQLTEIHAAIGQRAEQIFPGYDIIEKLGSGGMGSVFKARRRGDERLVAVKTLSPHFASQADAVDRFLREANLLRRIRHENLIAGLDAGYHRGLYFYVMELVEGPTLEKLMDRGPLPWKDALRIVRQIAQGLQFAAEQGIVHRDIKPPNIMIAANGVAKVADLGIAKFSDIRNQASMTTSSVIIGTPHYMSPEQAEGLPDIDHRSDMYSLGLTLFSAIAGHPPFQDEVTLRMMERRITEDVPVEELVPFGAPDNLQIVLRKMCARSRVDRYAEWPELVRDLMDVEQGRAVKESRGPSSPVDPSAGMLGRLSVSEGYVSPGQLEAAMKIQEQLSKIGTRKLLGNILVEEGFLKAADLKKLLSLQSFYVRHAQDKALGDQIVKSGLVSSTVIAEALREQKEKFQREGFSPTLEQILYQRGSITETQLRTVLRMSRRMNATSIDVMSGLKECPRCVEMIPIESTRCPRCRATLQEKPAAPLPSPGLKPCPSCGAPQDAAAKRCRQCDVVFETGRRELTQRLIACPRCGKLASDYQSACAHCQAPLRSTPLQTALKIAKQVGQKLSWLYIAAGVGLVVLLFSSSSLRTAWIGAVGGDEGRARLAAEAFLDACTHSDPVGARKLLQTPPPGSASKDDLRFYAMRMCQLPDGSFSLYRFEVVRAKVDGTEATVYLQLVFVNDANPKDFYSIGGTLYLVRSGQDWKIKF